MEVWIKNDDAGCTVSFMVEDSTDANSSGFCELSKDSIQLFLGSGQDYDFKK